MAQIVAFVQANLVAILSASLIASVFFSLGLMMRRRHVIQILPAPVSPGLEQAISAALASREIVYVQPASAPSVEVAPAKPVASATGVPVPEASAPAQRQSRSKPDETAPAIEQAASKLRHEDAQALDAAAREPIIQK